MAMNKETLKEGLQNIGSQSTEAGAISAWVEAYTTYVAGADLNEGAEANKIKITSSSVSVAGSALAAQLVGMSNTETAAGTTLIPAAIVAFWASIAAQQATAFAGATLVTPPPHATLAAGFAALMTSNVSDPDGALDAVADLLHQEATTLGTVTFVTPIFPII